MEMDAAGDVFQRTGLSFTDLPAESLCPSRGIHIQLCPDPSVHFMPDKDIHHNSSKIHNEFQFIFNLLIGMTHLEHPLYLKEISPVCGDDPVTFLPQSCDILYDHLTAHFAFSRKQCA